MSLDELRLTPAIADMVELTVVVPTFNERENLSQLVTRLDIALKGIRWEVIFVDDDSPDGTADVVRAMAQHKSEVRIIQRIGRRGLASACVEGMLSSSAPYLAVIDADLQHDEAILPQMLQLLKEKDLDVVVGSRYSEGGSVKGWDKTRMLMSRIAGRAARIVIGADLKDPMSGFFVMRRQAFDGVVRNLSQQGFKILLDMFASAASGLRFAEVPYQFRPRIHGDSKLDSMVVWEYGMLLADKMFGHIIPARLVLFGAVGALGLLVHITTLAAALSGGLAFTASQALAVLVAMTFNFTLNNLFTYADRRLHGWGFARGLLSFYMVCSIGAVANVGVASLIYSRDSVWWVAGLAGAFVGVVWNYGLSGFFTWRGR